MRLYLHGLILDLDSPNAAIRDEWRALFDVELQAPAPASAILPDVTFRAEVRAKLPAKPSGPPLFDDPLQQIRVYQEDARRYLIFSQNAHFATVTLPVDGQAGRIQTVSLPGTAAGGRFEDVTSMALAPILRRHKLYMIHAFAVAGGDPPRSLLLVGDSGSGKTTTGLVLAQAGRQVLANDVALLRSGAGGVAALLSPGTIHVTAHTLEILPTVRTHLAQPPDAYADHYKIPLPRRRLLPAAERLIWAAPINTVYFPRVSGARETAVLPVSRAVGLARLLSASMDRWDAAAWDAHLSLLNSLAQQVRFADLLVGMDVVTLATAVAADLGVPTRTGAA